MSISISRPRTPQPADGLADGRDSSSPGAPNRGREERGETLALLVVWPALITAILLMLTHAFIVTNARAEAELAASQGLRSAWRASAGIDFDAVRTHTGPGQAPGLADMAGAASDAAARVASSNDGWRWWTPDVATVASNWCGGSPPLRPGENGWVRVTVSGEVFGPLAALWPNRWDRIYAVAQGPIPLVPPSPGAGPQTVPAEVLPDC